MQGTNIFAALCLLASCSSVAQRSPQLQPLPGRPVYDGEVTIDPSASTLSANWRIDYQPTPASYDSVAFLLNRALRITSLTGASIVGYSEKEVDGWNRITVRFNEKTRAGTPVRIDIGYSGKPVFGGDSINGIRQQWIELGLDAAWHPVFANYDQSIRGHFRLRSPANWQVVASGSSTTSSGGVDVVNSIPLIDLAFVAAPALQSTTTPAATVFHVNADTAVVRRVLDTTAACAAYLNQRYGVRESVPQVKIVMAPRNGPGYARTNYIVITDVAKLPPDALSRFLCHELAHFWSTGAIASGPENWLNEAFAEFVSLRYVRQTYGAEAYQKIIDQMRTVSEKQPAIWKAGATARPGGMVSYRKAPYLLHRLEERIGAEMMEQFLARRMVERVVTTRQLIDLVGQVAGAEYAAWFEAELGT
jgi:hypothetical protein